MININVLVLSETGAMLYTSMIFCHFLTRIIMTSFATMSLQLLFIPTGIIMGFMMFKGFYFWSYLSLYKCIYSIEQKSNPSQVAPCNSVQWRH